VLQAVHDLEVDDTANAALLPVPATPDLLAEAAVSAVASS
jgi:hypothetical protein